MILVTWIGGVLLATAAALALVRIAIGPTMLNRVVAMDVLIAVTVAALGLEAAVNQHSTTLPVLVVLSLMGFIGSVSVARFASRERTEEKA
jgi:multicomponent Na+:H+ antiporter subunit F